jgi:valyl-tRNA synthetase
MMFGLYATGEPPFKTIVLHGMVRDQFGKKMSKTAGNGVDPIEWMDRYGTDALRFTLTRGANPGTDVPISEEWVNGSRSFCTKLWNATKFAMMNGATVADGLPAASELTEADRWILGRLDSVVSEVDGQLADYQFAKATETLYQFTWNELCDWYLELAKEQLYNGSDAVAGATRSVLGHVLDTVLRLLHPFIPFITEKLWIALTGGESLVIAKWPVPHGSYADPAVDARIADVQKLVTEVRRFRADQGLRPGQKVAAKLSGAGHDELAAHSAAIRSLVRLTEPDDAFSPSASIEVGLAGGVATVELDLSGTVDVAAERKRLQKDLAVAEKELAQTDVKLANTAFIDKAPAKVIDKIKTRRETAMADIERINVRLAALPVS